MNKFFQWFVNHKTLLLGLGVTMGVFVILVLLFDFIVLPLYTNKGAEKELPDVTEIHFQEATLQLEKKGFELIVDHMQHDATYPESTVIYQDPEPFTKVKRGRRIYVTLSRGERLVIVPKVIGRSERDAGFDLKQAGLKLGEIFYEYDDYYNAGIVTKQTIEPETEVTADTPIDITVSNGRLPTRFLVPDVVGKSLDTAKKMLRRAGLRVGTIRYEIKENLIPETVIMQSIDPDEEVNRNTRVRLLVSKDNEEF